MLYTNRNRRKIESPNSISGSNDGIHIGRTGLLTIANHLRILFFEFFVPLLLVLYSKYIMVQDELDLLQVKTVISLKFL